MRSRPENDYPSVHFLARARSRAIGALCCCLAALMPSATLADTAGTASATWSSSRAATRSTAATRWARAMPWSPRTPTYALDGTYALGRAVRAVRPQQDLRAARSVRADRRVRARRRLRAVRPVRARLGLRARTTDYALGRATCWPALTGSATRSTAPTRCSTAPPATTSATTTPCSTHMPSTRTTHWRATTPCTLVTLAGGTVTADLTRQIGVMIVDSKNASFAQITAVLRARPVRRQGLRRRHASRTSEAITSGQLSLVNDAGRAATPAPIRSRRTSGA